MRAIHSDGLTVRLRNDLPEPIPGVGDAIVHPLRVLLSGADRAAVARGGYVGVVGHVCVGVVKRVNVQGDASAGLAAKKSLVGRKVLCATSVPCGMCDMCRRALSAHCRDRRVPGVHGLSGGLAELVAYPMDSLHALPEGVGEEAAVFAPWLASAAHTATMLRSEEHSYITVIGESTLGLLTARVLARRNASVRLLSAREQIADLCERWGVKQRGPQEPGRRQDQDVVVVCAGSGEDWAGLSLALQMVRPRGLVVLKSEEAVWGGRNEPGAGAGTGIGAGGSRSRGGTQTPSLIPAIVNEVHIVGSREGSMPEGLALAKEYADDMGSLMGLGVVGRVGFEDAGAALTAMSGECVVEV